MERNRHILKSILGLGFQLAKSGFKLKNEGSYLGILWYLLEPLLMFLILLTIRNIVAVGIENYPLYLLLGLVMFNFFKKTTGEAVGAVTSNSGLIKTVKLSNEVFLVSTVLKGIFSHFFEMIVFMAFLVFFNAPLINIIFYPLIFPLFCLFVLGVSFMVSTAGVYISDFRNLWRIFTRLLWFATPIFYSAKLVLPFNLNSYNPVYYFITIARELIIYSQVPELWMILGMILSSFAFFVSGIFIFGRFKAKFAERI